MDFEFNFSKLDITYKGIGRKFSREGQRKKDRKIALLSLFQEGGGATEKKTKK